MASNQYVAGIIATTHMVRNTVLTLEALENAAKQITENERKVAVLADHDHSCPPLGMTVAGRVVKIEGGHHGLKAVYAYYGKPVDVELPNGDSGFLQELPEHPYPLTLSDFRESELPDIQVDPANFDGFEHTSTFLREIQAIAPELEYKTGIMERRALIPDPEVVFSLGLSLSATWFVARVSKAAADAIEPRLKRFFDVIIETVLKTAKTAIPSLRPITYIVKVNGKPNVDFVVKSRDPNLIISAFSNDFSGIQKQVVALSSRFDAEMIQFLLDEEGQWKFNYLLTHDGKVIGSKMSYDRQTVLLRGMKELQEKEKLVHNSDQHLDEEKSMTINNIENFQGVLGNVTDSTVTQTNHLVVNSGDFSSLAEHLRSQEVSEQDIVELKQAIENDPAPTQPNAFGSHISTWMGKMMTKAADGSWNVGVTAAGGLLATALGKYYGIL